MATPSGPWTSRAVGEGVRTAVSGMGIGARPMFDMWPFLHADELKERRMLVDADEACCGILANIWRALGRQSVLKVKIIDYYIFPRLDY